MQSTPTAALFPIIAIEVHNPTIDDVDEAFNAIARVLEKQQGPYIAFADLAGLTAMPDAKIRQRVAERRAVHHEKYGARILAVVNLVDSSIIRGTLTAINWLKPVQAKHHYVATRKDGIRTCMQCLETGGIAVPERVRAYMRLLESDPRAPFP